MNRNSNSIKLIRRRRNDYISQQANSHMINPKATKQAHTNDKTKLTNAYTCQQPSSSSTWKIVARPPLPLPLNYGGNRWLYVWLKCLWLVVLLIFSWLFQKIEDRSKNKPSKRWGRHSNTEGGILIHSAVECLKLARQQGSWMDNRCVDRSQHQWIVTRNPPVLSSFLRALCYDWLVLSICRSQSFHCYCLLFF